MYLSIIILPLLGSIVAGFFGRKVGVSGAQFITCFSVITTTILAIIAFFEVGFNNIPVSIELFRWIDSEWFNIVWGFEFDSLTVSMLIPVLIISSLVHIYSISYMSNDPHIQRFFSYLSLFTFMMIILVTANNYLLMFVGWEGYPNSLRWLYLYKDKYFSFSIFFLRKNKGTGFKNKTSFILQNRKGKNIRYITNNNNNNNNNDCLIVGSLLGNSYMEKNEKGVRIVFIKCSDNIEYLMQYYSYLINMGYCKLKKPGLNKLISKKNKILYYYKIESYYLTEFERFFQIFYKNNLKIIPLNLNECLTPLSLSIWYLDNNPKFYISDNQSYYLNNNDLDFISQNLKSKFDINTKYKLEKGLVAFYIEKANLNNFSALIKPHISPSLQYKLNNSHNKFIIWNSIKSPLRKNSNPLLHNILRNYTTNANNLKYSVKYKKEYVLSNIQKEALIGIILGDGFIERLKPNHNARLRIEQSYPEKSEYLNFLYELLEPLTAMEPTLLTRVACLIKKEVLPLNHYILEH